MIPCNANAVGNVVANLEVETKFELDEAGFERLKSAGRVEVCLQLNVYFDRDWALADRAATFRIRSGSGTPTATLKLTVEQHGARRTAREVEVLLTRGRPIARSLPRARRHLDVARDLPHELKIEMMQLGIESLDRVGWMRNERHIVHLKRGGRVELDRLILPNGATVFEAEIESPPVSSGT